MLVRRDPESRLIFVGDASMNPYELYSSHGGIMFGESSAAPSIRQLQLIADTFPHSVWLNPRPRPYWPHVATVAMIAAIFPMFELTLDGLEQAVTHLMSAA